MSRTRMILLFAAPLVVLMSVGAQAFLINKDVVQTFVDPQDNYEIVLAGDWRGVDTSEDKVINPFGNGTVQKSYNGTNTTISFAGNAIPQGSYTWHFGFGYGMAQNHGIIIDEYWTRMAAQSHTPAASTSYDYNPATRELTVTISNDTASSVYVTDSFFDVFTSPVPLAQMNRTNMPPGSGTPTGVTPVTLAPAETRSFVIPNIDHTNSIIVFLNARFASPPPGGYSADVGIWTQASGPDFAFMIPTVSEWGLIVMTLLLLTAATIVFARRRRTATA